MKKTSRVRNVSLISLSTLLSRLLGFVRDIIFAAYFGTGYVLEAFIAAFRLPNMFRSVFGEGFLESAAVPVLSQYEKDSRRLFAAGGNLIIVSSFVLLIFVFAAIIFSKYLVALIAPGFIKQKEVFSLAISFSRIMFFYLFFIGLVANISSILYIRRRFFPTAFAPVLLNISFIVGVLFFKNIFGSYVLVYSVIAAGILKIVFLFYFLKKEGFKFEFNLVAAFKDTAIYKMIRLFLPRLISSLIYQLSVIVDTVLASLYFIVGKGGLGAIYYANRIIQFPIALVALSLARVAIVDLSSYRHQNKIKEFKDTVIFSFENIIFFIIPVVVFLLFFSSAVVDVLFHHGQFGTTSFNITTQTLFFYSLAIFFFAGIKVLVYSFYALGNTSLPAKTAALSLVINIIASGVLIFPLKIGGVALGSSISAAVNFFLLAYFLKKRVGEFNLKEIFPEGVKVLLLSILAGVVSFYFYRVCPYSKYLKFSFSLLIYLFIFFFAASALNLKHIVYFKKWLKERVKK